MPKNKVVNRLYTSHFTPEIANSIVDKTGISERRFAEDGVCSSDLCFEAATKMFQKEGIDRAEIKILIFVSQTPDYRMPATAVLLQDRLGLDKTTMAFDINLGCSGFVYGLSVIFGLLNSLGDGKGLLLVGETRSRVYSPKDRRTAFLFGDGGVACLIDKDMKHGKSYFDLYSDGSNSHLIKMDSGGYRNPSNAQSFDYRIRDIEGNAWTDEQGYMDGSEVFNFVLEHVPSSLKSFCKNISMEITGFDYYLFHQANLFMNQHLVKKLKLDASRVLSNLDRFGNTSSVSIPLTMATELYKQDMSSEGYSLLCGFGVGMSWAHGAIKLNGLKIGDLIEC